jgi:hypothetical protein
VDVLCSNVPVLRRDWLQVPTNVCQSVRLRRPNRANRAAAATQRVAIFATSRDAFTTISSATSCTHIANSLSPSCLHHRYLRISQEDEEELRQLEMEQIAMENGSDL